jgi:hypothetical protein
VVDWIALCEQGVCHLEDGDVFSLLDPLEVAAHAAARGGAHFVAADDMRAVLLAMGPVCGEGALSQLDLRGAIQGPRAVSAQPAPSRLNGPKGVGVGMGGRLA